MQNFPSNVGLAARFAAAASERSLLILSGLDDRSARVYRAVRAFHSGYCVVVTGAMRYLQAPS